MTVIDTHTGNPALAGADQRRPASRPCPGYQELAAWLTAAVARHLNVSPDAVDADTPLADYGLDSAASLEICANLEREKGIVAETTIVYDYATIDAIAEHLVGQRAAPGVGP